jgi:hypothetical protein
MGKTTKLDMDFTTIVANVDKVRRAKAKKSKKVSTSVKPLKFDLHPDDSPLKAAIVERINAKDLVYSDLYDYCSDIKDGDTAEGQKLGYNIISGLRHRHSMLDTTFSMLCDFLGIDVLLAERKEDEEDEDE